MKRLLPLVLLLLLAVPGVAHAESADQVAAALRTSPVFQQAGVDLVDVAGLRTELDGTDPQVYLAVLSGAAAGSDVQARSRAVEIGRALGDSDAVVLVITENGHLGAGAGAAAVARGVDARQALSAARKDAGGSSKSDLTALVTSFAERVTSQAGTASSGGGSSSGGTNLLPWAVGGLVVAGGAAFVVVGNGRKRRNKLNEGLRADVEQLYNRLASDVSTIDAGDNEVARQALADAAERYNATGATLASADSPPEFAAARRTAIEGLTAAQTARRALGLDPGPEVPSLSGGGGPHLTGDQRVQFQGQEYDGSPTYQPGRGHYFEGGYVGGQQVPGGWYSAPFWTPFLLGGILTGGFGGGGMFGGGGFERGYEAGRDDANDGGGDWGGGGGDWGGGGGGDWGGGGDAGGGGDW